MIIAKLKLLDEMPKTCAYCPYALHSIGFISCDLVRVKGDIRTKLYGDITKRPDECPLVEVDETAILDGWEKVYPDGDEVEDKSECVVGCDGYCEECPIAEQYNLEDDDSPCRECEAE